MRRRAGGLVGRRGSRNVALASAGGKASASSEYPDAAIHKIAHLNDGQTGNDHSWIAQTAGKGWAIVAWPIPLLVDRVVWGRDRLERYQDRLATDYSVEVETGAGQWRVVRDVDRPGEAGAKPMPSTSEHEELLRRREDLRVRLAELSMTRRIFAGTFTMPEPTHRLRRGDPMQPAEPVTPSAPSAVDPPLTLPADAPEPDRRASLASWLGDPRNPLPARVMVNRVWHYHFGRGIVATPGDFGFNGTTPTHPALLDWLASEYVAHGFRLKPIHRLIVLSAAYRQSSRAREGSKGLAVDRADAYLWRFPPADWRPSRSATRSSRSAASSTPAWEGRDTRPGFPTKTMFACSIPSRCSARPSSGG